jgi:hypothetical protein
MAEWHHPFICSSLYTCVLLVDTMAIGRGSDHPSAVAHLNDVLQRHRSIKTNRFENLVLQNERGQ